MKRFSIEREIGDSDQDAIMVAVTAVHEFAHEENVEPVLAARLAIIVEELVANVLLHGAKAAPVCVDGRMEKVPSGIHFSLVDDGQHFNPKLVSTRGGPDPESGGGSGIPLVRAWSDGLQYKRVDKRNCLELLIRA